MIKGRIKSGVEEAGKNNGSASSRAAEMLTDRIRQGLYLPGSRLPAERDLAAEMALDRSAIRAALAELTRAGLIVRERGCRPRVSALPGARSAARSLGRPLRGQEQVEIQAIAVVVPQHLADHGSREIVCGISHVLHSQEAPYRPLLFDTSLRTVSRAVLEQEACAAVAQGGIAGAIVWPTLEDDSLDGWRQVQASGYPVVFVDRFDDALPCDFVGVDNYAAAREAVEFLLRLGHTRIAHLTHAPNVSAVAERTAGYRAAMQGAGLAAAPEMLWTLSRPEPSLETETISERLDEFIDWLLTTVQPPTAVFAINDRIAHTLIARLEARGKRVPEDLSVLGFDDEDQHSARPALLTTVRQPFERIGQRAAELLLRRLGAAPPPLTFQHILLPTFLVERSTCRPARNPVEKSPSDFSS